MRAATFAICVIAVTVSSRATAWAQTTDRERAETHFELGRRHVQSGHCDLAIEEFRQSIDFEPTSVGARLNLGDCYVVLGRLPEAFRQYKDAEANARLQGDARVEAARRSAAEVEGKLLRVIVREPEPAAAGVSLSIDGAPAGTAPWTIAVTPDTPHVLEATAPDGRRWRTEARGHAGETFRFDLATAPASAASLSPASSSASASSSTPASALAPIGLVTGAVGLAAIGTGIVFGVLAASSRSDLADAVNRDPQCSGTYPDARCDPAAQPRLHPIRDRAFTQATIADVGLIGGAVLLAGGIVMFLVAPRSTTHVVVGIVGNVGNVGNAGNGATLGGSF